MKQTIKTLGLACGILAISNVSYAQKKNETSAAVEFKNNFQPAMMKGNMEAAKKSIEAAKGFIDLAAAHEDTKGSQKTLFYKAQIYNSYAIIKGTSENPNEEEIEGYLQTSLEAYKAAYVAGKKYKSDVEESALRNRDMLNGVAGMAYEAEKFDEAAEAYDYASKYSDAVGMFDSVMVFNAALCFEKSSQFEDAAIRYEKLANVWYRGSSSAVMASSAYRAAGNTEKAKEVLTEARKKAPNDRELLLELVNTNLDAGDVNGAELALSDAIKADPNNKQLHYNIGTIYINIGDERAKDGKKDEMQTYYGKAEDALNKALELDPNYVDANYQLGAHLFNWSNELKKEAGFLDMGDPREDELLKSSSEKMNSAVQALEAYIVHDPNNKPVLNILYQAHYKNGNTDKAMEYKKRYDAAE